MNRSRTIQQIAWSGKVSNLIERLSVLRVNYLRRWAGLDSAGKFRYSNPRHVQHVQANALIAVMPPSSIQYGFQC